MHKLLWFSVAAFSVTTSALADEFLSGADLQRLAPGLYHVSAPGLTIDIKLAKGGGISGVTEKGDTDKGRWRIAGDHFCIHFKNKLI